MNTFARKATPEERAENEAALARLQKAYPNLGDADIHDFLMNATAYPAASLPYCVDQAMKLVERSGGDWRKACDIAEEKMFKQARAFADEDAAAKMK